MLNETTRRTKSAFVQPVLSLSNLMRERDVKYTHVTCVTSQLTFVLEKFQP